MLNFTDLMSCGTPNYAFLGDVSCNVFNKRRTSFSMLDAAYFVDLTMVSGTISKSKQYYSNIVKIEENLFVKFWFYRV